jgi:predicted nuclease of predicted toxin-antitoxin system
VKVLLDENLPHRLRNVLGNHEVLTVRFLGWSGLKNGELLRTAERDGFQVFLTGDQTVSYEQNLSAREISVVVLSAIEWEIVSNGLPAIHAALEAAVGGSVQFVDVGTFQRNSHRSI